MRASGCLIRCFRLPDELRLVRPEAAPPLAFVDRRERRRMLVVHIITDLQTGGAEMAMKRLLEASRMHARFDYRVISLRSLGRLGAELRASGIPVEALGMRGFRDIPSATLRLTRMLRELRPDVVHTWMYHADFL